jgi:Mrp family chromosome partitioning ATPase
MVNVHRVVLEGQNHPRPLMLEAPDSAAAAGFRVLRHRLAERGGTRTVLVASPSSRDGKTTCALNLWVALGEARRSRALLVEANLRDPAIAQSIGFDPPVCIGKQMEYYLSLGVHAWDVAETFTPWLHAAAVSPSSEKREMVEGAALSVLVKDMQDVGYDFIVVDSPAIMGSADATLAEDAVEGVLMVVRRGKTRARDLRQAVEQIGSDKLLGFVLLGR